MHYKSSIFPGVPLIESPIFDSELPHLSLDPKEEEIALALNRKGYAVFDFPDPDIELRIERIRTSLGPVFGLENDGAPDAIKTGGIGRVQDAWKDNADVHAIAANEVVIGLLTRLYGRQAFPFQTLNFPVGTQQHPHTDAVHFSSVPERFMCGVWLAMEDIGLGSGPLCYVPGSHKWPILSNSMIGRRGWGQESGSAQAPFHDAWNAMIAADGASTEVFLARKGQALIWTANLLHGGSVQTDPTCTRWSQVTHYFFDDCIYYTPAFSDEPLGRLALRNVISAVDSAPKPNMYLGEKVEDEARSMSKKKTLLQRAGLKVVKALGA